MSSKSFLQQTGCSHWSHRACTHTHEVSRAHTELSCVANRKFKLQSLLHWPSEQVLKVCSIEHHVKTANTSCWMIAIDSRGWEVKRWANEMSVSQFTDFPSKGPLRKNLSPCYIHFIQTLADQVATFTWLTFTCVRNIPPVRWWKP